MPYLDDQDHKLGVSNRVEDAVVTHADAPNVLLALKFLCPWRIGVLGERINTNGDPPLDRAI